MTLDNIMDLAKGETQDKTYQIGETSAKTGLVKTANGWRKPKAGEGAGAKTESKRQTGQIESPDGTVTPIYGDEKNEGPIRVKNPQPYKSEGAERQEVEERITGPQSKWDKMVNPSIVESTVEEIKKLGWKNMTPEDILDNYVISVAEAKAVAEELKKSSAKKETPAAPKDSAPLTRDTKIKLSQIKKEPTEDKVYQVGEISEKTGLQKTANGWVKPKTGEGSGANSDPKLAKEIANGNHFEEQQKAAKQAKRDAELHQQRAEGEANAEAYRKRYEAEHSAPKSEKSYQEKVNNAKNATAAPGQKIAVPKNAGRNDFMKVGDTVVRIESAQEGRYGSELGTLLQYEDPETRRNRFVLQNKKTGEARDVTKEYMDGVYDAAPLQNLLNSIKK